MIKCIFILILIISPSIFAQSDADTEGRVKTVYGIDGRPLNQSEDAKGSHILTGSVKLSSGSSAILNLNTSTANGAQDISFISSATYSGTAWSLDTSNTFSYKVYPLSGVNFIIKSSDGSDTATVQFRLEGE